MCNGFVRATDVLISVFTPIFPHQNQIGKLTNEKLSESNYLEYFSIIFFSFLNNLVELSLPLHADLLHPLLNFLFANL